MIDLVKVVVWPPGITLVRVVTVVDVMTDGNVGGVPDGVEGNEAENGEGEEGGTLREDKAEGLIATVGWLVGRLVVEYVPLDDIVVESEVIVGVISGVLVIKVLKALGGAMLFIH